MTNEIEITIDKNSDRVEICDKRGLINHRITVDKLNRMRNVQLLIIELINAVMLDSEKLPSITVFAIDEDHRSVVEQW